MVAGAEQTAPVDVPHGEREITKQMICTSLLPDLVGVPQELDVRQLGRYLTSLRHELGHQAAACVDSRVSDDPCQAIERERLLFPLGLISGSEEGMAKAGTSVSPDLLGVGATVRQSVRHPIEQLRFHGRAIEIHNPSDSAHWRC